MNNRILELAERAEIAANKGDHVDVKIMMEKFAELIVKETIDEMITQMWHYGIDESNNPQFYKMTDRTIQEMLNVAPAKD